jgi:hypothetical protein
MPLEHEFMAVRDRVTALETKVDALAETYASQVYVEREIGKIGRGMERMEVAIESMAQRMDAATTETGKQLQTLFSMHSTALQKKAEQDEQIAKEKLEQQRQLSEERLANERQLFAEKLAAVELEKREKVEAAEARRVEAVQLAEAGKLLNRMKDWKFVVGFLTAVVTAAGLLVGGLIWLIHYVQSQPK